MKPAAARARASSIALLYAARGVRGFGDGFAIIILPAYLTAIGYDPVQIGIVATASLLGTALLTLAIGTIAARYDLRTLLLAGACLMAVHRAWRFPTSSISPSSRWWRSSARSIPRPAISACWCRSSTPCWRTASPTRSAPGPSRATA